MCTKQGQEREQGIQLPVLYTLTDHRSITEVFYHLNRMLIATKHIADNNLVFHKTAHWHILYATQSKPLNFTFSDL